MSRLSEIEQKAAKYARRHFDLSSPKEVGQVIIDSSNAPIPGLHCRALLQLVTDSTHLYLQLQVLFVDLKLPFDGKKVAGKKAPWSTAQPQLEKIKHLHPLPGMSADRWR